MDSLVVILIMFLIILFFFALHHFYVWKVPDSIKGDNWNGGIDLNLQGTSAYDKAVQEFEALKDKPERNTMSENKEKNTLDLKLQAPSVYDKIVQEFVGDSDTYEGSGELMFVIDSIIKASKSDKINNEQLWIIIKVLIQFARHSVPIFNFGVFHEDVKIAKAMGWISNCQYDMISDITFDGILDVMTGYDDTIDF